MVELPLLLAENGLHNYLGLGWSVGGAVVALAATAAVMRYRQGASEDKDKEQDQNIGKLSDAVNNLPALLSENASDIKSSLVETEKNMSENMRSLEKTITKKVDSVKDEVSKQSTRLAVMQTEVDHLKKDQAP